MVASHDHRLLRDLDLSQISMQQLIDEWREWWQVLREFGSPHFGEMALQIARIREALAAHFQREEHQGAFSEAGAFAAEASFLENDHQHLLEQMDCLVARLKQCRCEDMSWDEAGAKFETFLQHLEEHENAERKFLEQRFS